MNPTASTSTSVPSAAPQLEHLGFEVDRHGGLTVHVRGPGQSFGLTIEQALRRIDEFKAPDRARIIRALSEFFNVPMCPTCGNCIVARAPVPTKQRAPRRAKKTNVEETSK